MSQLNYLYKPILPGWTHVPKSFTSANEVKLASTEELMLEAEMVVEKRWFHPQTSGFQLLFLWGK